MKCESDGLVYTSMPPQFKCKNCGKFWRQGEPPPKCKPILEKEKK